MYKHINNVKLYIEYRIYIRLRPQALPLQNNVCCKKCTVLANQETDVAHFPYFCECNKVNCGRGHKPALNVTESNLHIMFTFRLTQNIHTYLKFTISLINKDYCL